MSINKVILVGNLGRDPETRYTQSGKAEAILSLGTSEKWTDKATGEKKEKTEWHRIKIYGKRAETIAKYAHKGSQLYIEGRISYYQYDKNGVTQYGTDIICNEFKFLSGGTQSTTPLQSDRNQASPPGGFQTVGFPAKNNYPTQGPETFNAPSNFKPADDIPY